MVKVKIDPALFDRAKPSAAEAAGYSSVEEFVADCIEKEIQRLKIEVSTKAKFPTNFAAWDISNDARPGRETAAWLSRRGKRPGAVRARPLLDLCQGGSSLPSAWRRQRGVLLLAVF